jgi:signal transduction histidine kinase
MRGAPAGLRWPTHPSGWLRGVTTWRRYSGRLQLEIVLAFIVGVLAFVLAAVLSTAARSHVPAALLGAFFIVVVVAIAHFGGILYALPVGVVSVQAFDWYFLLPLREFDAPTVVVLGLCLVLAVLVGAIATGNNRRAVASEEARGVLADEQAALRRVATLVARQPSPAEVFAAVTEEAGKLLHLDVAQLLVYADDGTAAVVAAWSLRGGHVPVGTRLALAGDTMSGRVLRTQRPVTIDDFTKAEGWTAEYVRSFGVRAAVGTPIVVEGRVWGLLTAATLRPEPLPVGTESRLGAFAELVAMAISNADSRAELTASRARVVAAADETRRRLERDLHDGMQQRLVSLALQARAAAATTPEPSNEVQRQLSLLADGLGAALEELREVSHGIHPAILSEAGLGAAVKALARRSAVPIALELTLDGRLAEPLEVAAYYVVSEAITNAVKHAQASAIELHVDGRDGALTLSIRDDGIGGADLGRGSGILGLKDRVEALGGRISLVSPSGEGTTLHVQLPSDPSPAAAPPGQAPQASR